MKQLDWGLRRGSQRSVTWCELPAQQAWGVWGALYAARGETGLWPVLVTEHPVPAVAAVRGRNPFGAPGHPRASRVRIALVPTLRSWEAPWWLNWGNAPPLPRADVSAELHARWCAAYGAELVSLGPQHLELRVATPVASRDSALQLAAEQLEYCPGLTLAGQAPFRGLLWATPTAFVEARASELMTSTQWLFSWSLDRN
jgi:hypothetical protein